MTLAAVVALRQLVGVPLSGGEAVACGLEAEPLPLLLPAAVALPLPLPAAEALTVPLPPPPLLALLETLPEPCAVTLLQAEPVGIGEAVKNDEGVSLRVACSEGCAAPLGEVLREGSGDAEGDGAALEVAVGVPCGAEAVGKRLALAAAE